MSEGTEVPEEFYFAAALTFVGATSGNRLKLNAALNTEPRLFTVLLGESGDVKKSSALRNTTDFFRRIWERSPLSTGPIISHGVGSAEGLAEKFKNGAEGVVLCLDELKSLVQKTKIESSALLPMIASLFEQNSYENTTKKQSVRLDDARFSMLGCCTTDTYKSMWTGDAVAIGFPNRLFVVVADRKRKVCWPEPRDEAKLESIRTRIISQLDRLPVTLAIESDAKCEWERWYEALPSSIHAKRLDSIGFRLLSLIALTTDKQSIDLETVRTVVTILDYELSVRTVTDPVDADGTIAKLEETIRRQLAGRGPLTKRELLQFTNARRSGGWYFDEAIKSLVKMGDVRQDPPGKFQLSGEWVGVVKPGVSQTEYR
jgi:hypothetical protein